MILGFSFRMAVSAGVLCAAGLLAVVPAAADVSGRAEPSAPAGPRAAAPHPSLLHRPGTHVRPRAGVARLPEVSALSWLVADARSGEVLAAHNAHRRLPPASTLKTLFALTVLPALPSSVRHTVRAEELRGVGAGSSLVGVAEGRTYRIADLWRGVFLNSGNDAVHVLAELNGGWRATARRMQAEARSLGAHDTRVLSPDGYDTPGQVSSAFSDLAIFGRVGLRNPDFARYCATVEARFPWRGRLVVRDPQHQPAAERHPRCEAVPGADRHQERLHQQGGQHARRGGAPGRAHPRRDGDEPSAGRRGRRLRGGALTARLGVPVGREGRTGGLGPRPRGPPRGRGRRRCPRPPPGRA
ncbi:hypothetical protein SPURM210S_07686 [Streptomyces purpurascens]